MPKYTLQEMSDMHKKGERRVYPKLDVYRLLDTDDFVKRMVSYERAIPSSIIKAVLSGLSDTLKRVLSEGYTVKIDELGVFSLSLDFADDKPKVMQEENDKMAYRRVQVKNVNFKVDPQLLKQLQQDTDLERSMSGVKVIRKNLYTREERIQRALQFIETNGFIHLTEYASLNNLNRTAASLDLKQICSDPHSPITSSGRGTHKVWVKRADGC
ncbi:MAG: hypothetical protein PUF30_11125 [bacterium]|nr:hypothetical protein [bacterium]